MPDTRLFGAKNYLETERRIIGVEVTLRDPILGAQEELFMLLPPGGHYDLPAQIRPGRKELIVTFHTSHGDIQIRGQFDG